MQLVTLYESSDRSAEPLLPSPLRSRYDGDLIWPATGGPRPLTIANFVQSLDGIVSLKIPGKAGGGEISGDNEEDQFIMGLLRAHADAVIVGAHTFQEAAGHRWTPEYIYPALTADFADLRKRLGKAPDPLNVIVSASGDIDLDHSLFSRDDIPSAILTTAQGAQRLHARCGMRMRPAIHALPGNTELDPRDIGTFLFATYRVTCLLHEGGPTLLSGFLGQRLIDELFLTVAPHIIGSGLGGERPTFSGRLALLPDEAPWASLVSVKKPASGAHLFLRYRFPTAATTTIPLKPSAHG